MMKNAGIIIEMDKAEIKEANWGMITLARAKGIQLSAFVFNADGNRLKEALEQYGITKIIEISLLKYMLNNPVVRAKAILKAMEMYDIPIIFGLSTAGGKDLLPRIAASLDAPLVMDIFDVDLEHDRVKTSMYSGKTTATLKITGKYQVLGIRPNAVEPVKAQETARILTFDGRCFDSKKLKVLKSCDADQNAKISLPEAEIIIAGGRGMKNGENFSILSSCAKQLNAAVGASRVAVDSGWVPYSMQVGQTGEKVSPRVYIACGISGSIQHFAGMKTSGLVIAVNTDENAAILSNCDYYVKADALKIIPALTKCLENG